MKAWLLFALLAAVPAGSGAAPDFVPKPSQAFEGFVAINAPRPEVPVGALWIDGYGPTGEAASADNLETVRSLNGMTIDRNLQLSLTAGLLDLIGIDPRIRNRFSARFSDLTNVRVKDVSKLSGARGEPRIVEAIKAASVTVSSDGEIGLNARTMGWQLREVRAETVNGRTRSSMIEGRDLFIAMRVATLTLVRSKERKLNLTYSGDDRVARLDDFRIVLRPGQCENAATCAEPPSASVIKISSHPQDKTALAIPFDGDGEVELVLPVPIADGRGGLFERMLIERPPGCGRSADDRCDRFITVRYAGERLADLKSPSAKGW